MKLNPKQMADIYHSRLGRKAIHEIDSILKKFENAPNAQAYWIVVRSFLEGKK